MVETNGVHPVIFPSLPSTIRGIGQNEYWLQDWLVEDPTRLGLGNVVIKAKELRQNTLKGGRLDILAYDAALDTFYEIEVMLGNVTQITGLEP